MPMVSIAWAWPGEGSLLPGASYLSPFCQAAFLLLLLSNGLMPVQGRHAHSMVFSPHHFFAPSNGF